ncbi:MAG: ABC transporter ATP-binding protein [Clostridia bacterium]
MLRILNITKKINNEIILKNISLELDEGKIYGFVGKNGSGKTMLFKTIAGLIKQDKGEVILDNYKGNLEQHIATFFSEKDCIKNLSGYENLCMLSNYAKDNNELKILQLMSVLGIYEDRDKKVYKYSLGMKQKLGIIQALIADKNVLILDEPFNALDKNSVNIVRNLISDERKKGKIILVSSHVKENIQLLCDEIITIKNGCIVNENINVDIEKNKSSANNILYPHIEGKIKKKNYIPLLVCIVCIVALLLGYNNYAKNKLNKANEYFKDEKYLEACDTIRYIYYGKNNLLPKKIRYSQFLYRAEISFDKSYEIAKGKTKEVASISGWLFLGLSRAEHEIESTTLPYRKEIIEKARMNYLSKLKKLLNISEDKIYLMSELEGLERMQVTERILNGENVEL